MDSISARPSASRKSSFAVGPSQKISRQQGSGFDLTLVKRRQLQELHLTVRPLPGETLSGLFGRVQKVISRHQAAIVKQDIFGSVTAHKGALRALAKALGTITWPITWLDGADCEGGKIAGMHILAVQGVETTPILLDSQVVGNCYHDGAARHCYLGDLSPANLSRSKSEQSRRAYAKLEAALAKAGMVSTDVIRTWFYLDDILSWYGHFNKVRTDFFRERKVFDHLVPASTGVGASNPMGAALALTAWAVKPKNGSVKIKEVGSPLQCPAPKYGSSFSRAVEISTPENRYLIISGTASIEPGGASVHDGDIEAQVDLTMRVIQGILKSRKMNFLNVHRATAYFKHKQDARAFTRWCEANGASFLPVINTRSDVCRDELLFEIEMDAVAAKLVKGD